MNRQRFPLLAIGILVASGAAAAAATTLIAHESRQDGAPQTVVRVPVTGTIELGLSPFVKRSLREAAAAGASAVVLEIDTPGGRVDAAWEIIDAVRDADVPVYALVNRRALSAGAMIALSADRLYMLPGSTIGAATPVIGDGEKASEKMVSAMRSEFRALAEERGIDPRIGEAMVDESVEVPGVVDAGKLLTLTTSEALELGVATARVADYSEFLETAGLRDAATIDTRPNWTENIVRFLTHPAVAPLLLSLGFLGLLVEIKTPSFGIAGAIGLLSLAAFFGARYIVSLAGMEEVLLLGIGLALIAAEVLIVPGFGVAGIAGGIAVLLGVSLSMLGRFPTKADYMGTIVAISLSIVIVALVAFAAIRHLPHSRSMSGILLKDSTSKETGYLSAPKRAELEGKEGLAATDLRPSGTAVIGDERVDVVTEGPWIEEGTRIVIMHAEGYRFVVRPAAGSDEESAEGGGSGTEQT